MDELVSQFLAFAPEYKLTFGLAVGFYVGRWSRKELVDYLRGQLGGPNRQ